MKRDYNYRKKENERVVNKRVKIWSRVNPKWAKQENVKGMFKKNNFSCNCQMCKPHKHKLDKKYKYSERKFLECKL